MYYYYYLFIYLFAYLFICLYISLFLQHRVFLFVYLLIFDTFVCSSFTYVHIYVYIYIYLFYICCLGCMHTQEEKQTYAAALDLHKHIISLLKIGSSFSSVYNSAVEYLNKKNPQLSVHLSKSVGHSIGLHYRDPRLTLNAKNDK